MSSTKLLQQLGRESELLVSYGGIRSVNLCQELGQQWGKRKRKWAAVEWTKKKTPASPACNPSLSLLPQLLLLAMQTDSISYVIN